LLVLYFCLVQPFVVLFKRTSTAEITFLSLHDALPIWGNQFSNEVGRTGGDRSLPVRPWEAISRMRAIPAQSSPGPGIPDISQGYGGTDTGPDCWHCSSRLLNSQQHRLRKAVPLPGEGRSIAGESGLPGHCS